MAFSSVRVESSCSFSESLFSVLDANVLNHLIVEHIVAAVFGESIERRFDGLRY